MLNPESKIIVVIPAYNEGLIIKKTLTEVLQYINKENVVVVDDGSTDNTFSEVQKTGVIVLRHILNCGAGAAIKTGLDFAVRRLKADVVVTFDADGQHNPQDIKKVVEPILNHQADVVIGSRFIASNKKIPWQRVMANKIANILTYLFFGVWADDSQSGLRAFSRSAAEKIDIKSNTFEFSSEILAEIKRHHLKVVEAPIDVKYTAYSLSKGQSWFTQGPKTLYKMMLKKIID